VALSQGSFLVSTNLKMQRLRFKSGPTTGASPLELDVPTVTILVGPNNSGKSLALREIENWCYGIDEARKVVDDIEVAFPATDDEIFALLEPFVADPPPDRPASPDVFWIGYPTFRSGQQVQHEEISRSGLQRQSTRHRLAYLRTAVSRPFTVRLDGRTRFSLADPKPSGDLLKHAQNHLWALIQEDHAREKVRQFTSGAFGLHFVIDATAMRQFRVRMSPRAPSSKVEEQAFDENARTFHKKAALLTDLSDGVQAFTGLVSAVLSLPHKIILIDEPEAFLHPMLARRLGRNLATVANERDASLLAATHSAEFLMGCIETTPSLRIVRLTYEGTTATSRSVDQADLQQLMSDPLLRSMQALRGLFHRCVVVTEADRDRAFYDEISHRLQGAQRGIGDALFLNAQNWQTIPRIVNPLRRFGIPAAAVMDFDVITDEQKWQDVHAMLNLSSEDITTLERVRQAVKADLDALPLAADGRKQYKVIGIAALAGESRKQCEHFLERMASYGLFIVPVGQVEHWLSGLGVASDPKQTWLMRIFSALGSDPRSPSYVRPAAEDVWSFVDKIGRWADDPQRSGIPL
jgi:ABC-type cobalamin/Fe3+-siderophores transport system ATPase subunit